MDDEFQQILSELGATNVTPLRDGGQKKVFRAEIRRRAVALKYLTFDGAGDGTALIRARREFRALDAATSSHLAKAVSDLVELEDGEGNTRVVAWAEEFIPGADLRDLTASPWTWADTRSLLIDVGTGLQDLHASDIVHRDLSPANVRRRPDGQFVVLDPGYAKFVDLTTITATGHQPGTLGHLSPEHFDLESGPERRSDIFQLGILAFMVLCGSLPFPPAGDYVATLMGTPAPPVADFRSDLSESATQLVARCLANRAIRRFQTATELVTAAKDAQ